MRLQRFKLSSELSAVANHHTGARVDSTPTGIHEQGTDMAAVSLFVRIALDSRQEEATAFRLCMLPSEAEELGHRLVSEAQKARTPR